MKISDFQEMLKNCAETVGPGAHKITPRIDVYCESEEIGFKIAEIEVGQSLCGCPIGITILVEREE